MSGLKTQEKKQWLNEPVSELLSEWSGGRGGGGLTAAKIAGCRLDRPFSETKKFKVWHEKEKTSPLKCALVVLLTWPLPILPELSPGHLSFGSLLQSTCSSGSILALSSQPPAPSGTQPWDASLSPAGHSAACGPALLVWRLPLSHTHGPAPPSVFNLNIFTEAATLPKKSMWPNTFVYRKNSWFWLQGVAWFIITDNQVPQLTRLGHTNAVSQYEGKLFWQWCALTFISVCNLWFQWLLNTLLLPYHYELFGCKILYSEFFFNSLVRGPMQLPSDFVSPISTAGTGLAGHCGVKCCLPTHSLTAFVPPVIHATDSTVRPAFISAGACVLVSLPSWLCWNLGLPTVPSL